MTLPKNIDPGTMPYNDHHGEEMIYVLKGIVLVIYGDDQHYLAEGDCICFDPTVPHKIVCASKEEDAQTMTILFDKK